MSSAGFTPGIYIGQNSGFTSAQQLYQDLSYAHYWQGNGTVLAVTTRGYQMTQSAPATVSGVSVSPDQALNDSLGGQVVWLITKPYVPGSTSA